MVNMVVFFTILLNLNVSYGQTGCSVTEDQLHQIANTVLCQKADSMNTCKDWLGLANDKKMALRAGMSIGGQTASSMWRGALNASKGDLRLTPHYKVIYENVAQELEKKVNEYKAEKPALLEGTTRKEQLIFEQRLQYLKESGYPDETFKKMANAYVSEKDEAKKAHWAKRISDETFADMERNYSGTSGLKKFEGRANFVSEKFKELEGMVKGGTPLSLDDKKRFMDMGFREAELNELNRFIELKKDPQSSFFYRRLLEQKRSLSELALKPGEFAVTPDKAKSLVALADKVGTTSDAVLAKMSALKFYASTSLRTSAVGKAGAAVFGPGVKWASEKVGARAVGYVLAPQVQIVADASEAAAAVITTSGTTSQDINSRFLERTEEGGFVPEVTPLTVEFLALPWEQQKQELNRDAMLCDKMKGVYNTSVNPGWEVSCTSSGFSAKVPAGWASSVKVEGKVTPEGDLQTVNYESQGIDYNSVSGGGFQVSYAEGSPKEVRYHKFSDVVQFAKWRTGTLGAEEARTLSDYSRYYDAYPVRGTVSEKVTESLSTAQKDQRFLVEAGACCSQNRSDVGEDRCRALGVNSTGVSSPKAKPSSQSTY